MTSKRAAGGEDCCMKLISEWTFEGSLKSRTYIY